VAPGSDRWFPRVSARVGGGGPVLFCFPFAGGGAAAFRAWARSLPVEVRALEPPGRGRRLSEPPATRLEDLVADIADAMVPIAGARFAFFGHSLGALLAYETTRELVRRRAPTPFTLMVSGHAAPTEPPVNARSLSTLDDAALVEELRALGGTPPEVFADAELLALVLPTLRADFALAERYVHRPSPRLAITLVVFGGDADAEAPPPSLAAWRDLTAATTRMHVLPGGHFFIDSARDRLLDLVARELGVDRT
jgi:surfactin synthase thioesterase subunit